MNMPVLYRKRLIPDECVLLDKDRMLSISEDCLITAWNTIRPKKELSHGISAYFWKKGVKVSKFYNHANQLICWYCDIITHQYEPAKNTYTVTDLLTDVLIYPDGNIKVVDLDELSEASEKGLLSLELLHKSLHQTDTLLRSIYNGTFKELQDIINNAEKAADQ